MPEHKSKIEEYVDQACAQVRWKRAKEGLSMELRTHLLDQRDDLLADGMSEEEAQAESVRQMGDPVEVGTQLDRIHRPKPQWDLMVLVFGLVVAGLVIQGTIMMEVEMPVDVVFASPWFFMERSVLWAVLGGILMLAVYWLDYTLLGRWATALCALWAGITAVSLPISRVMGGRAIDTYYLCLLTPVCMALLVYGMRGKGWKGLLVCWAGMGVFAAEAAMVPAVSLFMLMMTAGIVLILAAVWRGWLAVSKKSATALTLALGIGPAGCILIHSGYVRKRLVMMFHPELDPMGKGYMAMVVRQMLQRARWLGKGALYEGPMYDIHSDHFLTWVIYRLGWAVGLALVAALVLLLAVALRRCFRQKGMLGFLLSLSAVLILGAETVVYVFHNLGFGLLASVALPFLSYGGRYMVINLFLAGLLMSVFREERLPQCRKREVPAKRRKWITLREDGAVVILPPWVKQKLSET